jgi:hypothetical protein
MGEAGGELVSGALQVCPKALQDESCSFAGCAGVPRLLRLVLNAFGLLGK